MDKKISEMSLEKLVKLATDQSTAITAKDAELDKVKKELDATVKINAVLSKKIEQLPKAVTTTIPSFSAEGVTYVFNYGHTVIGDKKVTIKDIIASEELQSKLIASKSGMISIKK